MYSKSIRYLVPIIACAAMPVGLALGLDATAQTSVTQKKQVKEYVGSKKCAKCHEQHYEGWKSTLHTKMEQKVIASGFDQNVFGDFSSHDPS